MELIAIGFLLGVVVCFVVAGAGVVYAERMASRKHDHNNCDNDVRSIIDDNANNIVGSIYGEVDN